MDASTKRRLDSLDARIKYIESEMPGLAEIRSPDYFFVKRELDYTFFLSLYYRDVFDEDLDDARILIDSRINGAKKRSDLEAINFFTGFQHKLTLEIGNQQRRYNYLFAKEKNFRKEFNHFIDAGDEYSLERAKRMTDLAIKFASEKNLTPVLNYLEKYQRYAIACLFDFESRYDLKKLTASEQHFQKIFALMVQSDSLELIKEAGELVNHCYNYAASTKSVLDTNYFAMQRRVVNSSISDYFERKGNNQNLATMVGQSVIARFDTLNKEGIYKWHDNIVVVGHFKPDAKFDDVRKGEAIIDADHRLLEYIRVNRLAKLKDEVKIGQTYLIPFFFDNKTSEFCFNPALMKYQYMVCYTRIESTYFTREISKFLPPLQFNVETDPL
jgi:hypothetical protein